MLYARTPLCSPPDLRITEAPGHPPAPSPTSDLNKIKSCTDKLQNTSPRTQYLSSYDFKCFVTTTHPLDIQLLKCSAELAPAAMIPFVSTETPGPTQRAGCWGILRSPTVSSRSRLSKTLHYVSFLMNLYCLSTAEKLKPTGLGKAHETI